MAATITFAEYGMTGKQVQDSDNREHTVLQFGNIGQTPTSGEEWVWFCQTLCFEVLMDSRPAECVGFLHTWKLIEPGNYAGGAVYEHVGCSELGEHIWKTARTVLGGDLPEEFVTVEQERAPSGPGAVRKTNLRISTDTPIGALFKGQGAAHHIEIVERSGDTVTYSRKHEYVTVCGACGTSSYREEGDDLTFSCPGCELLRESSGAATIEPDDVEGTV